MADDGNVGGILGRKHGKICGIIWHPEREKQPSLLDLALIKRDFYGGRIHAPK